MWPISVLNWSLFGQLPRGPFFTLFGWPKPWELSLIVLGRSVGGPNCGSFCLIGQNSGSYRLYKPKTMGAIAQNEPPEAKTMEAIARNESPGAKTMGAITQNESQRPKLWELSLKTKPQRPKPWELSLKTNPRGRNHGSYPTKRIPRGENHIVNKNRFKK